MPQHITTNLNRDIARDIARIYCTLSLMGVEALAKLLVPLKFAKGSVVLEEGEVCRAMYYVSRGMVRQYYYKNQKDVTEHFSYEGRICFCIESFLKQEPSRIIVEALEPTTLYAIPYEALHVAMMQNNEIELLYRKILEHALISSQAHADSQRFENARERYERLLRTYPEIVLRAPMLHIASFLQMTPETLSRVRSAFNKESVNRKAAEGDREQPV
ncbi:MAG: Crp/Fnr family transcriptional regulator [Prevotellaceae bacterium]|nr:Crp/Fnr family transcriptional regulator [Prevotellaceae bacterium]MCD8285540.1 Crp/Fnr family transcriptional regulator [Prevotellaceae bacterium]